MTARQPERDAAMDHRAPDGDVSAAIEGLLHALAAHFAARPTVRAVAHAGSRTAGLADARSDVDLYVYDDHGALPLALRRAIAGALADPALPVEVGNTTWEPGDEWIHAATGIKVDVMFRAPRWIEEQLAQVLVHHRAATGYTTCFWFNVLRARALHERDGWYTALRQRADVAYPEPLVRAIVARNHPILRERHSSYRAQIALAIQRRDRVSVSHRLSALLASYFDILFAVNRQPHPGEKRLIAHAERLCPMRPLDLGSAVDGLLASTGAPWAAMDTLDRIDALIDGLDPILRDQGLLDA